MRSLAEIRLGNLRRYLEERCGGNQSELARRTGKHPGYISDLLRGQKSFGEKVARDFERQLRLAPGVLDDSQPGQLAVEEPRAIYADTTASRIVVALSPLDDSVQQAILTLVESLAKASHQKKPPG